jgi:hypothetical protein
MGSNIFETIIANRRLPVLFIGAGISKRYLYRYPNWTELLELSYKKINDDSFQYQKHKDYLIRQELSDFEINTQLGTIIENEFNAAFFDRRIKLNVGSSKNPSWVKRGTSPYKMFLSSYFKNMVVNKNKNLQDEISKFKSLKNKISAVITTNYDLFLEKEIFTSDFTVFVRQNELFSSDSYNIAEIYKIHGSVKDADSILITKKDYDGFHESRKLIIAKMLTLFAESPIIFMGYSFTDENIQSIIAEFLSCLTNKELKNIDEHFIFVSHQRGEDELIESPRTIVTANSTEIPITEVKTDNFAKIYDSLNEITPGISPKRVRETRRVVKTIVDQSISSNSADSLIVGMDILDDLDLTSKPIAIAIGYRDNVLNKIGYGLLSDELILEDILFDNKHFDADEMCFERYKSLPRTLIIPVFKYVSKSKMTIPKESKLGIYIDTHNSVDKIITKSVTGALKNVHAIDNFQELTAAIGKVDDLNKKAGILLKNIQHYSVEQIREICVALFRCDSAAIKKSTNFKRCVLYLDFMENYTRENRDEQ